MELSTAHLDRRLPTGEQYTISGPTSFGLTTATLTEVAASLRALTVDGVDIVQRYPEDVVPPLGAGIVMVPWPNRVDGGRWLLEGEAQQLDISEPKHNNAIHGLLTHTAYRVQERTESSITLAATIFTAPGYPFVVDTTVTYSIGSDGLRVRHTLTNRSGNPAPVAVGTHCYFRVGDADTGDLTVTNSAETVYTSDGRYLPTGRQPVSGEFDLRSGRRIADLHLDDTFTDQALLEGEHRTRLTAPDGRHVEVWTDRNFGHVVLLTTRSFVGETGTETLAVAIEPQTSAGDALNNGVGLRWLAAEDTWAVEWGVRYQL